MNGTDYVFWAWKGDYLNLGAGAELGIYKKLYINGYATEHWTVDTNLALPMTLTLFYKDTILFTYNPQENQWWIAGFDPLTQNVKAEDLKAVVTIDFTNNKAMYNAFINSDAYKDNISKWKVSEHNKYELTYSF